MSLARSSAQDILLRWTELPRKLTMEHYRFARRVFGVEVEILDDIIDLPPAQHVQNDALDEIKRVWGVVIDGRTLAEFISPILLDVITSRYWERKDFLDIIRFGSYVSPFFRLTDKKVVVATPPILRWQQPVVPGRLRLHSTEGPAVVAKTVSAFVVRGIQLPPDVFKRAKEGSMTPEEFHSFPNAEVREAIMEVLGVNAIPVLGGRKVAKDEFGILWEFSVGGDRYRGVEVTNSTPEPDGSYRKYLLWTDPRVQGPREALALSFGLSKPGDYAPVKET